MIFMVTALVSAIAPSLAVMVAAQFVGGLALSVKSPIARLMVVRAALLGRTMHAVTIFATISVMGPLVGPVFSGVFVAVLNWRAIFAGIALVGPMTMLVITLTRDDDHQPNTAAFDWQGLLLKGTGLASLVADMAIVRNRAFSLLAVRLFVAGGLILDALCVHARRVPETSFGWMLPHIEL
tara:strand:+ start:1236 stop:1778 length:543 start_codon:yes stop_codon:yes gene_type:complete